MSLHAKFIRLSLSVFVGLFLLAYGFYLARIIKISRSLNTPYATVFVKLILRTAVLGLLIISILGPTFGDSKREIKSVGKDIMICVDLSKSMDAFDVQPTRLEKVKFEMKKIVWLFALQNHFDKRLLLLPIMW